MKKKWDRKKIVKIVTLLVFSVLIVGLSKTDFLSKMEIKKKYLKISSFDEIEMIDGKVYKDGEPYWGTLKKGQIDIKDGLVDGKVKTFEGPEYAEFSFKKGKLEGKSIGFKPQGKNKKKIYWEADIKDGQGTLKEYYVDGTLKGEATFADSLLEGERYVYFKDGSIKEILHYKSGKLDGEHRTYYSKDKSKYIGKYKDGILVEAIGWHDNGKIALEKKDGIVKFYDYSGHMTRKNDLNEMKKYYYYDTGELKKVEGYLKADLNTKNKWDSKIYYYNQLGLFLLKRDLKDFEFNEKEKNLLNVKINSHGIYNYSVDVYERYNELGQKLYRGRLGNYNLIIYGEKSRIQEMYYSSEKTFLSEDEILSMGIEGKDRFSSRTTPIEYDSHGRILTEKKVFWDGLKAESTYEYDKEGRLLKDNMHIMGGDEGSNYIYDENGKFICRENYGLHGMQSKYTYEYDENGRKIKGYEQTYKIDKEDGDYEGKGILLYEGKYTESKNTLKFTFTEKKDESDEYRDSIRVLDYDNDNNLIHKSLFRVKNTGKLNHIVEHFYIYYEESEDLYNPWKDIEEVANLYKDTNAIRREDALFNFR